MKKCRMLILLGTLFLGSFCGGTVFGASSQDSQPPTWNLSNDISSTGNQISFSQGAKGVWYFMESHSPVHNPLVYQFLPEYHAPSLLFGGGLAPDGDSCWQESDKFNSVPAICFNFNDFPVIVFGFSFPARSLEMHPAPDKFAIVAGKSPIKGVVRVTGTFSDIDPKCGNGVIVSIDQYDRTLFSANLPNGGRESFDLSRVKIRNGDVLYFIVDPNGDFFCDSTGLDVTIHVGNGKDL